MRLIYIAGPFRAPTAWAIEQNIRRAETLSLEVWKLGAAALCPHANARFFHGLCDDQVFLDGTLEMLRRCDAVLVCAGWTGSTGTKGEIAEAHRLNLPVFFETEGGVDKLSEWIRYPTKKDSEGGPTLW